MLYMIFIFYFAKCQVRMVLWKHLVFINWRLRRFWLWIDFSIRNSKGRINIYDKAWYLWQCNCWLILQDDCQMMAWKQPLPNNCLMTVASMMSMPRWSKGSVPDSHARGPRFDPPCQQVTATEFFKNLSHEQNFWS